MDSTAEQTPVERREAHDEADTLAAQAWLRSGQVAALFRVHPRTVIRWANAGRLPQGRLASVRTLGGHRRYPQAQVDRLLAEPGDGPAPGQVDDLHEGPASTAAAERPSPGRGQRHDPAPAVIVGQAAMHDKAMVGHPRQAGLVIARTQEP